MLREPRRTALFWCLSQLYRLVVALRRWAYAVRLLRQTRVACPVIVIGNVVAGGSGKTPVCMQCVTQLQTWGYRVGVVSRGYGRARAYRHAITPVTATSHWTEVGEEPLLIFQATHVPVVVGAQRAAAAQALLQAHPEVNLILCDDGLQHYALARDLEVVVLDERGHDGGRMLPYGWLREPWPRRPSPQPTRRKPVHRVQLGPLSPAHRQLHWQDDTLAQLKQHPSVAACAAIGQPERFFSALKAQGLTLHSCLSLPDHAAFASTGPFATWLTQLPPDMPICCTQKDAVKLQQDWPQLQHRLCVPQLHLQLSAEFWHNLRLALNAIAPTQAPA